MNSMTLQFMDDDYVHGVSWESVRELCLKLHKNSSGEAQYFQLFHRQISSSDPQLGVICSANRGWFLSLHEPQTPHERTRNFLAYTQRDFVRRVQIEAWEYVFDIPETMFLPCERAITVIEYYCKTGKRCPTINWLPYEDLEQGIYAEMDC